MQKIDKKVLFEQSPVPKAVHALVFPTILSSIVTVIYSLADTYFVGMLNDSIQTAAVSLAAPAMLAFYGINNLFGVGTSSAMSRALGRGDRDSARRACVFGFYCALFFAALYAVLTGCFQKGLIRLLGADETTLYATQCYLRWAVTLNAVPGIMNVVTAFLVRSEGNAACASIGTIGGCVLNIILDPIFIMPWGLNMGVAGAGVATFLSNTAAMLYFLLLIHRRREHSLLSVNPMLFRFEKTLAKEIFGVGIPAAVQNLLNVTSHTVFNNFASAYGADAVAAMGIAQKIQMIAIQISIGGTHGLMPFVGYNYSAKNRKRMTDSIWYLGTRMTIVLIAICAGCCLLGRQAVGLFIRTDTVITYGAAFLIGMMWAIPFQFIDFLAVGVFQAIGDGKKSLYFAILRKLVLEIPAVIILDRLFPMYGIAYAMLCAEVIMAFVAVIMLRRSLNKTLMQMG